MNNVERIAEIDRREAELNLQLMKIIEEIKVLAVKRAQICQETINNEGTVQSAQEMVSKMVSEGVPINDAIKIVQNTIGGITLNGREGYDY